MTTFPEIIDPYTENEAFDSGTITVTENLTILVDGSLAVVPRTVIIKNFSNKRVFLGNSRVDNTCLFIDAGEALSVDIIPKAKLYGICNVGENAEVRYLFIN